MAAPGEVLQRESGKIHDRARRHHPVALPLHVIKAGIRARRRGRQGSNDAEPDVVYRLPRPVAQWRCDTLCACLPLRGQHRHCGFGEKHAHLFPV